MRDFDAFAVDLDGVITNTAVVHAAAWKRLFDDFLEDHAAGGAWIPFEDHDYKLYVDGRPRRDGLRGFLTSRAIELPEGSPLDPPDATTIYGLAARKDAYVHEHLARQGIEVFVDTVGFLRRARAAGARLAVVTASANCPTVLAAAQLTEMFDVHVDGNEIQRQGMRGKPAPDTFLEAVKRLGTIPRRTVVIEDAISGVEAARAGAFGFVIGVDRAGDGSELRAHGADTSVASLGEVEIVHTQPAMAAP